MAFLLGSTWLALHVFVAEHLHLLVATALCGVAPARTLRHRTAVRARAAAADGPAGMPHGQLTGVTVDGPDRPQ